MRIHLGLGLVVLLSGCDGAGADRPDAGPPPLDAGPDADPYAVLTATMEAELAAQGTFSAALALVEHGELTYAHGFGGRRPGDPTPVAPTTRFRIASLSKMLTAIAVLQQVQAGTLELATPVTTYLPELGVAAGSEWLPAMTPHHLLSHGSGMTRAWDVDAGCPAGDRALQCWVTSAGFAASVWLMFPPGRMWSYSNVGYRVLGAVVERASGRAFPAYMQDRVFAPLGMTRTTYAAADVLADGDYSVSDGFDLGVSQFAEAWRQPSGGVFSTVIDLAKVARFLIRGDQTVLSAELRGEMTSAQVNTDWTLDHEQYGYGLFVDDGLALADYRPYDFEVLLHDGLLPGYNSLVLVIPSRQFALVFLASGAVTFPSESIDVALHRILGLAPVAPLALPEDPADLVRYPGAYAYWTPTGSATLTVTLDAGTLRASGAMSCALVPQKVGNFTCGGAWLTFVRGADGRAEYVRGDSFVAHRVP